MERKSPKRSYKGPILISALAGFCLAYIIIYIAAFMGKGGRYHSSIATMLFFLIILVVVCTGIILARINRTRDEILDRLEALEQREPEQSPPPQPVPPEAPDSPTSPSEKSPTAPRRRLRAPPVFSCPLRRRAIVNKV